MMDLLIKKTFQLSTLCVAMSCATASLHAFEQLEKLEDSELGETTGEGIAFLPQDFSMAMNAPRDDNSVGHGGGSVRLIPVGPLSTTATAKGYSKADGWLYGVSLAQSKDNYNQVIDENDWGVPFGKVALTGQSVGATDFGRGIESWGTAENPWIIKANTAPDIPNFKGVNGEVAYFTLEAPLRHNSLAGLSSSELSAYNLKLGMWADFFMRNSTLAESTNPIALDPALSNRLRLAMVWDGFGINGSNIKLFQTLGGVDDLNKGGTYTASLKINGVEGQLRTFNYGMDKSYNSTLGFSGLLRLNSGATDAKRGTVSNQTVMRSILQVNYDPLTGYNSTSNSRSGSYSVGTALVPAQSTAITAAQANAANTSTGITISYVPMTNSSIKGPTIQNPTAQNPAYGQHYPGSFNVRGYCTGSNDGNAGDANGKGAGVCRTQEGFTTRLLRATSSNTWTPPTLTSVLRLNTQEKQSSASDSSTPSQGGVIPNFGANANADGVFLYDVNMNIVLGNLYQPIILNSDGYNFSFELARIPDVPAVYKKLYQRYEYIDPTPAGQTNDYLGATCNIYQCHNKATTPTGNYQASNATHSSITIGATDRITSKVVKGVTYNNVNQVEAHTGIGSYGVSMGLLKQENITTGKGLSDELQVVQVWRQTRARDGNGWGGWGAWTAQAPKAAYTHPTGHPSLHRADPYETVFRQNYNNQILGLQTTMPTNLAATLNSMSPVGATPSNNFGSAAIDGLLIQHLKFSTTGLKN